MIWLLILFLGMAAPSSVEPVRAELGRQTQLGRPAQLIAVKIGFGGIYKLGCWTPVRIEIAGGDHVESGSVSLTVADTDGVPTTVQTPADHPIRVQPGQTTQVRLLIRPGQANGPLTARWIVEGQTRASRTFHVGVSPSSPSTITRGMAATTELLLVLSQSSELAETLQNELLTEATGNRRHPHTVIAHTANLSELPDRSIGYEGFGTVVLVASGPDFFQPLGQSTRALTTFNTEYRQSTRLDALSEWVELGGRLVLFCGRDAEQLIGDSGPLARLVPGQLEKLLPFRKSAKLALETYSGADKPIRQRRFNIKVPKLKNVQGHILAHAGREPADLPLVIRGPKGFGELFFVAIDVDQPPLSHWPGRLSLFRTIFQWPVERERGNEPASGASDTAPLEDLTVPLHRALDSRFQGIETVSFAMVAFMAAGYIALIGPGDFFLLKRLLRRMELTWLTLPLIIVSTSVGAYWLAHAKKGSHHCINQVEIIDIDTVRGISRGTVWTHLFNPRASKYNLTAHPRLPGGKIVSNVRGSVSWLGLPGYSLGGMQSSSTQNILQDCGYSHSEHLDELLELPIQTCSTKTLTARWIASAPNLIDASLHRSEDELLTGQITNQLDIRLTDCLLMFGRWAYHIPRLEHGATAVIDDSLYPRTVKTMLTSTTAGDLSGYKIADDDTVAFQQAGTDVARITKAMMFYDAIGGAGYTNKLNRYQPWIDMSDTLERGHAIFLARSQGSGTEWIVDGQPLHSEQDSHWLYLRFMIPVGDAPPEP